MIAAATEQALDLDRIIIRLIEKGQGYQSVPMIERAALDLVSDATQPHASFELDDLVERLRVNGHEGVVELMDDAIADLMVMVDPLTSDQVQYFGTFTFDKSIQSGGIPELHYRGNVRHSTVICSVAAGERYAEMQRLAAPTMAYYARRHGMDCIVREAPRLMPARPASWDKLIFVKCLLEHYETVIWMDADIIITDPTRDIRDALDPECPLHVAAHMAIGDVIPNFGMFVIRRDPRILEMIERMWASTEYIDHDWWEQAAFMKLMGIDPITGEEFEPSEFAPLVGYLDVEWNSLRDDGVERPIFRHFAGESMMERLSGMPLEFGRFLATITNTPVPPCRVQTEGITAVERREDIPRLLTARGLTGRGVHVGVQQGKFSSRLLREWACEQLISVDCWVPEMEGGGQGMFGTTRLGPEYILREARTRLRPFRARSELWIMDSLEAAARVADGSLDFVYLESHCEITSATEELVAWVPKVRPGGVVAIRDFSNSPFKEDPFSVEEAVKGCFGTRGIPVHRTRLDKPRTTWVVELPAG